MGCKKNEWVDRAPTSSSRAQLIGNTVNNPAGNSPGNVVFVPLTGAFQNPVPSSVFWLSPLLTFLQWNSFLVLMKFGMGQKQHKMGSRWLWLFFDLPDQPTSSGNFQGLRWHEDFLIFFLSTQDAPAFPPACWMAAFRPTIIGFSIRKVRIVNARQPGTSRLQPSTVILP